MSLFIRSNKTLCATLITASTEHGCRIFKLAAALNALVGWLAGCLPNNGPPLWDEQSVCQPSSKYGHDRKNVGEIKLRGAFVCCVICWLRVTAIGISMNLMAGWSQLFKCKTASKARHKLYDHRATHGRQAGRKHRQQIGFYSLCRERSNEKQQFPAQRLVAKTGEKQILGGRS